MLRAFRRLMFIVGCVALLLLPLINGCTAIGAIAGKTATIRVKPSYTGFKGETVGVMAWATRPVRIDHPLLQLDIARGVEQKLKGASKAKDPNELKDTQFPPSKSPDAMYAYMQNHPDLADSVLDFAPRLGVSRLIYIEVDDFSLHPEDVPELFRGQLTARVEVIEIINGKAKLAFRDKVDATFPEKSPPEGELGKTDAAMYRGVLEIFSENVLKKFVTYEEDE
jgi:hypothetical protein